MKGYKAYKKGLICQEKQYEEGKVYEEEGGDICSAGVMHFCENPLDTLDYYPLVDENGDLSEFSDVEALADVQREENKCATTKLKIGARLSLSGFIKAGIDFIFERTKVDGDGEKTVSDERRAKLAASGHRAQLATSGDYAQLATSGDSTKLAASGDYAKLAASGKDSIAAGIGIHNQAKASLGSWIVLAEWKRNEEGRWVPMCVKSVQVDGEVVKADTMYLLENGEFIEV